MIASKVILNLLILILVIDGQNADSQQLDSSEPPGEDQGLAARAQELGSSEPPGEDQGLAARAQELGSSEPPGEDQGLAARAQELGSSEPPGEDQGLAARAQELDSSEIPSGDQGLAARTSEPNSNFYPSESELPSASVAFAAGEPRVSYSAPLGYTPATGGPLIIKKTVTSVEAGKGYANRLRVDIEITSAKKNRNDDAINNIDIYELVDESLNLVPPADSTNDVKRLDYREQLNDISGFGFYGNISDIPLMNFYKASSLDEISWMRLNLLSDQPLASRDPKSYRQVYANPESKAQISCYCPQNTTNDIFYWNKYMGNDSSNLRNVSKYLKDNLGIEWPNSSDVITSYLGCSSIQMDDVMFTDKNNSDKWISFIIDDNRSEGRALLNVSDKMIYYLKFEKNETDPCLWNISDRDEIMRFNVKSLGSKDRLFYWYYVRPKKSGTFNTESIIRIRDEDYKGWPDIIYPLNIEVGKPDYRFEIDPILKDSKVYSNSWQWLLRKWTRLDVTYIIRYTGEASNTYLKKINIEVTPGEGILSENKTEIEDFDNKDIISLNRHVSYDSTGTYQIPAIWIEGTPYIFKETVTVQDPISELRDFVNLYTAVLGAVFLLLTKRLLPGFRRLKSSFESRTNEPDTKDLKSDSSKKQKIGDEEEKDKAIGDKNVQASEEAAKKMADLIIEALERGAKEKR
jgi:hypothetical protein